MRRIGIIPAVALLAGITLSNPSLAQQPANPPATPPPPPPCTENCMAKEVQGNYARVKANIVKSADKMPAEDYSYKPTPDIRTYARVLNHVTEAQAHVCLAVNGSKPDAITVPPETADKATIVTALNASFTECDKAYASLTDASVGDMIQVGPVKRSRIGLLWGNASHDNEQYATLALYLRLKGITPPSSEK
jgi:DinB superfamily